MDPNNPPRLQPHFQRKLLRKEKIIRLSHGQRPTKQNGRNRKGADEYAVEFQSDFTTSSFEEDGQTVKLLVCRFCTNQIIGARSDRIKEHLISQRHRKNKMASGFSSTDLDTQPQLEKLLSLPPGETSSSSMSKSSDDGHKSHKIKTNSNTKTKSRTTVKKKTVDEYATEYHADFTTNTIQKDGELVHLLVCRYCNCPVGARSDRIKEHLLSKRHLSTKTKVVDTNDSSMPVLTPEVDLDSNSTQSKSSDVCPLEQHVLDSMSRDSLSQTEKDPNKTLAKVKLVDVGNMIQECKKCARIILTSTSNGVKKHKARFSNNFKCSRCSFEGNSADEYWTHLKLHDSLRQCNCDPPSSRQLNSSITSQVLKKSLKRKKSIQADLSQSGQTVSDPVSSPAAPVLNTQPQPQTPPVLNTQPIYTQPIISTQSMPMMPSGYYATFNSQSVYTGQGGQPAVMYNTMPLVTQTVFNGQPVYTNTNNPPPPELDFEIPQNYIPLSNPMLNQGIRMMENFYELTAGEIKPENYITLQLDFSEY